MRFIRFTHGQAGSPTGSSEISFASRIRSATTVGMSKLLIFLKEEKAHKKILDPRHNYPVARITSGYSTMSLVTMNMTISVIEERNCTAYDALEESEKRWESQQTPAFPLPLNAASPKYPHRQSSVGLKSVAEHDLPASTAPPFPMRCPIDNKSTAPKYPLRQASVNCTLPPRVTKEIIMPPKSFPPPLRNFRNAAPKYPHRQASTSMPCRMPIRQQSVGCTGTMEAPSQTYGTLQRSRTDPTPQQRERMNTQEP